MGPGSAADSIKEAISMGCDDAILLSDRKFAGSDTWATAYVISNATTSERLWKIRRNITDAWKQTNPHVGLDDVVVPVSKIPECMSKMQELSKKYDIPIPCYGHAGDGNLHLNPHKNPNSHWKNGMKKYQN